MQCSQGARRRVLRAACTCTCSGRTLPSPHPLPRGQRASSTSAAAVAASPSPRNSRWLSDVQGRLGKCIQFGLRTEADIHASRRICQVLGTSWKGLVAGAEGFPVEPAAQHLPDPIWTHPVVWGEMDAMGHINNARYLRYAETSRVWFFRRLAPLVPAAHQAEWANLLRPVGLGLILKTIKVDFLLPAQYPDTLSLLHSLGDDSGGDPPTELNFRCWVLSHRHQRVAARIEENVPLYDYARGRKAPLPPWLADIFAQTRRHQDASRQYWTSVRANVDGWLKGLEESTIHSGREELVGKVR